MLLTGCNLPYTPLNKKQHSCKETIICEKHAVHPLMRLGLIFIFLHGICFQQRDFTSSKASAMKTRQFLKKTPCLQKDHMWTNTIHSLMKLSLTTIFLQNICLKTEGFHFLKRMLFCCFNHMEGILHTCSHDSFQTNPLLLHIFSYYCIILQSIDSQPCRGR